jgi:hypothetical protein
VLDAIAPRAGLVWLLVLGALAVKPEQPSPAPARVAEPEIICIERVARPAIVEPVQLERRWLVGDDTPAAWEPFLYTLDAQPRIAVASEPHPSNEFPAYDFGRDEYGGIWLVQRTVGRKPSTGAAPLTRDIFLLPAGASFRGVY